MDHSEAVRGNAAERYAIGDLPLAEVEEFERHFFECPQCSEDLRALTVLAANARATFGEPRVVVQESKPPVAGKVRAWWRQPWVFGPAFAAAAVAVLILINPASRPPQASIGQISGFPLFAEARGSETQVSPPAGAPFFTLYMDKTWDGSAESYKAVLRSEADNKDQAVFSLKDPGAGRFLQVWVPTQSLAPGRYVLVVQNDNGNELARYPFTLTIN